MTLNEPLLCNENILTLYGALPKNYDSYSGLKIFTVQDVLLLFKLYSIDKSLWEEYYNKLMYFHGYYMEARNKESDRIAKAKEQVDKQKKEKKQKVRLEGVSVLSPQQKAT